jgi:CheY-like chemotaxis protein
LPDIPGDEVLTHLLADPETRDIPVMILSADATPTRIERLLAQGARAYLTKPFDVAELLALFDATLA